MDVTQIRYRAGQPIHFISTRPFALANTGVTIPKGTDVMFDGTRAEVEGAEYTVPQLRGAVKAEWLVLAGDFDANARFVPQSAQIQVRHPTQGGNPMQPRQAIQTTVSEEERIVANASSHATHTRTANKDYVRGQTRVNGTPNGLQAGQLVKTQRGMMAVEQQDGTVVDRAPLMTAAGEKAKHQRTSADMAGEVLSDISKIRINPVQGVTRDELMDRMSNEEREQYLSDLESRKSAYVDEAPIVRTSTRTIVGSVKSTREGQREGMTFRNSVGGGTEIEDPTGYGGKVEETIVEQEGIKFVRTNGPKRDAQASVHPRSNGLEVKGEVRGTDARRMVAKSICPDFPDLYDFNQPSNKKIARITADFEDRPDVIRAIFAAEGDEFKMLLIEAFPAVFENAA